MTDAVVRVSTPSILSGGASITTAALNGAAPGDVVLISLTTNSAIVIPTTPSGWTLLNGQVIGTAYAADIWRRLDGTEGSFITITWGAAVNASQVVTVFDGTQHSGFGTIGTVTTRGGSQTTSSAVQTGSSPNPDVVISHEKAATHPSTPTVSPTTTQIANLIDPTASSGSVYVGSYDTAGGVADRTITYPIASANGCAYQVPLLPAAYAPPTPTAATTLLGTRTRRRRR